MLWTLWILGSFVFGISNGNRLSYTSRPSFLTAIKSYNKFSGISGTDPSKDIDDIYKSYSDDNHSSTGRLKSTRDKFYEGIVGFKHCDRSGRIKSLHEIADGAELNYFYGNYAADSAKQKQLSSLFPSESPARAPETFDNINFSSKKKMESSIPFAFPKTHFKEQLPFGISTEKRASTAPIAGCDCKIRNELHDLGQDYFPRYLLKAVCRREKSDNDYHQHCWRGSNCKPLEYKVQVLTLRSNLDNIDDDPTASLLPDELQKDWKFKSFILPVGCFCSY